MELYLFQREEFNRFYNCSKINIEDLPLQSRIHPGKGMIVIFLCAIFYILYIPCSFSLFKRRENACYKLMLYICAIDFSALWLLGFLQGWLSNIGAVYCSYPDVIYLAGVSVTCLWMTESAAQIFLAINRCMAILSPNAEDFFFKGSRTYFWLALLTIYGMYIATFTKPVLYTGLFFSWSFNPYVGYLVDTESTYVNYLHTVHDTAVAIILPSIYAVFFVLFVIKTKAGGGSKAISSKQRMLFIQILIIGFIHLVGCLLYASLPYVNFAAV
uniref:Uncharacterized protein n=1 Tax=Ditylenchus dipsaci TaxID=166011 RepID=A0A915EAY3_9BILA